MSIVVVSLGSVGDTQARSTHTCEIFRAPDANTLVLAHILASDTAGTPAEPSSVSGANLVFSLITSSVTFNPTGASQLLNVSHWRSMGAAPDASMISAAFANATTGACILVAEVSGVSTSGSSGSNALRAPSSTSTSDQTRSLRVIGASAASTANAYYAVLAIDKTTTPNVTLNSNWLSVDSIGMSGPAAGLWSAFTALSSAESINFTYLSNQDAAGVIFELVADGGGGGGGGGGTAVPGGIGRRFRIPPVPSQLTGLMANYLREVARQLNQEGWISLFSGDNPNTSGITGIPGSMVLNIGSASTMTRLWIQAGSVASISQSSWHAFRIS